MILSMTGFGEATRIQDGVTYHLDIRSLNNRYFKLNCKLPDQIAFLEPAIETRLRRTMVRGSVFLTLQVRNMSAEAAYEVNDTALASYIKHLRSVASAGGGDLTLTVDLATAVLLPGVAQPRPPDEARQLEIQHLVEQMVDEAAGQLHRMREAEGRALAEDLAGQLDRISVQLDAVAERAPEVVVEYRQRLTERVNQLLADQSIRLETDALAKEVALYADRSDINEELARLRSHIEQFRQALAEPDGQRAAGGLPVGRKLDFLSQELLREVNTISSKSNDAAIIRCCVEMKSAIDRIKEQVQNVV